MPESPAGRDQARSSRRDGRPRRPSRPASNSPRATTSPAARPTSRARPGKARAKPPAPGRIAAQHPEPERQRQRQQQRDRQAEQAEQQIGHPGARRTHPVANRAGGCGVERRIGRLIAEQRHQNGERGDDQQHPAEEAAGAASGGAAALAQPVEPAAAVVLGPASHAACAPNVPLMPSCARADSRVKRLAANRRTGRRRECGGPT